MTDYNIITYESVSNCDSHPERLALLGRLFGMTTPDPRQCRVLELGCGTGGNLIPMAWRNPQNTYLGVELAQTQVDMGCRMIAQLQLKNITIVCRDILEFQIENAAFDYIIVHGVYSWVPAVVRERILALCQQYLSPQGVAYISYNTLPGWRMRGMLRDMLQFHSRGLEDQHLKLRHAREFLQSLSVALTHQKTPYAEFLKKEVAYLEKAHDSYLYHEYLEINNEACFFTDFIQDCSRHQLRYLCDSELHAMFPSSLGAEVALHCEQLGEQYQGIVNTEQFLDFVRNRTFRQSLLCHADCPVDYEIDLDKLLEFAVYADLKPPPDLHGEGPAVQKFSDQKGLIFEVNHALSQAVLAQLYAAYPAAMMLRQLLEKARLALPENDGDHAGEEIPLCLHELFNLFANQALAFTLSPVSLSQPNLEFPKINALAQAEIPFGRLTTYRHDTLTLDEFSTRLLRYMDGHHHCDQIVNKLVADIAAGHLQGLGTSDQHIAANCERLIYLFARQGILEPV